MKVDLALDRIRTPGESPGEKRTELKPWSGLQMLPRREEQVGTSGSEL